MKSMVKALKWLDTLTAWAFVVWLACWSYDLFMVQSPARFPNFGRGKVSGDFTGVLFVMLPYATCIGVFFSSLGLLNGWPGGRMGWRMIIWMHTRLLIPTVLSYYTAWWHYDNARELFYSESGSGIMLSTPMIFIVMAGYFYSAECYYQRKYNNHQIR